MCVILSEAKESKLGFGSFASLRMTHETRIDLEASHFALDTRRLKSYCSFPRSREASR
jgi:hypothetical protein